MTETTRMMEPGRSRRTREVALSHSQAVAGIAPRPQPLIPPAPRSAMFFPLVVLIAVLPGLAALNSWDLTPPGPLWGLRALAVLDGLTIDQVPAAATIKPSGESAALRAPFVPASALRVAGRAGNEAERRPRSAGHGSSQLRGRGSSGRSGLLARAGLARGRSGAGRGLACRVQSQSALENARSNSDDIGLGRRNRGTVLLCPT